MLDLKIRALTTTLLLPSAFWGTSANICSNPNYSFCSKLALLQKYIKQLFLLLQYCLIYHCFTDWKIVFIVELLNIYWTHIITISVS